MSRGSFLDSGNFLSGGLEGSSVEQHSHARNSLSALSLFNSWGGSIQGDSPRLASSFQSFDEHVGGGVILRDDLLSHEQRSRDTDLSHSEYQNGSHQDHFMYGLGGSSDFLNDDYVGPLLLNPRTLEGVETLMGDNARNAGGVKVALSGTGNPVQHANGGSRARQSAQSPECTPKTSRCRFHRCHKHQIGEAEGITRAGRRPTREKGSTRAGERGRKSSTQRTTGKGDTRAARGSLGSPGRAASEDARCTRKKSAVDTNKRSTQVSVSQLPPDRGDGGARPTATLASSGILKGVRPSRGQPKPSSSGHRDWKRFALYPMYNAPTATTLAKKIPTYLQNECEPTSWSYSSLESVVYMDAEDEEVTADGEVLGGRLRVIASRKPPTGEPEESRANWINESRRPPPRYGLLSRTPGSHCAAWYPTDEVIRYREDAKAFGANWSESERLSGLVTSFCSGYNVGVVGLDVSGPPRSKSIIHQMMCAVSRDVDVFNNLAGHEGRGGARLYISAGLVAGGDKWVDMNSDFYHARLTECVAAWSPHCGYYVEGAKFVPIESTAHLEWKLSEYSKYYSVGVKNYTWDKLIRLRKCVAPPERAPRKEKNRGGDESEHGGSRASSWSAREAEIDRLLRDAAARQEQASNIMSIAMVYSLVLVKSSTSKIQVVPGDVELAKYLLGEWSINSLSAHDDVVVSSLTGVYARANDMNIFTPYFDKHSKCHGLSAIFSHLFGPTCKTVVVACTAAGASVQDNQVILDTQRQLVFYRTSQARVNPSSFSRVFADMVSLLGLGTEDSRKCQHVTSRSVENIIRDAALLLKLDEPPRFYPSTRAELIEVAAGEAGSHVHHVHRVLVSFSVPQQGATASGSPSPGFGENFNVPVLYPTEELHLNPAEVAENGVLRLCSTSIEKLSAMFSHGLNVALCAVDSAAVAHHIQRAHFWAAFRGVLDSMISGVVSSNQVETAQMLSTNLRRNASYRADAVAAEMKNKRFLEMSAHVIYGNSAFDLLAGFPVVAADENPCVSFKPKLTSTPGISFHISECEFEPVTSTVRLEQMLAFIKARLSTIEADMHIDVTKGSEVKEANLHAAPKVGMVLLYVVNRTKLQDGLFLSDAVYSSFTACYTSGPGVEEFCKAREGSPKASEVMRQLFRGIFHSSTEMVVLTGVHSEDTAATCEWIRKFDDLEASHQNGPPWFGSALFVAREARAHLTRLRQIILEAQGVSYCAKSSENAAMKKLQHEQLELLCRDYLKWVAYAVRAEKMQLATAATLVRGSFIAQRAGSQRAFLKNNVLQRVTDSLLDKPGREVMQLGGLEPDLARNDEPDGLVRTTEHPVHLEQYDVPAIETPNDIWPRSILFVDTWSARSGELSVDDVERKSSLGLDEMLCLHPGKEVRSSTLSMLSDAFTSGFSGGLIISNHCNPAFAQVVGEIFINTVFGDLMQLLDPSKPTNAGQVPWMNLHISFTKVVEFVSKSQVSIATDIGVPPSVVTEGTPKECLPSAPTVELQWSPLENTCVFNGSSASVSLLADCISGYRNVMSRLLHAPAGPVDDSAEMCGDGESVTAHIVTLRMARIRNGFAGKTSDVLTSCLHIIISASDLREYSRRYANAGMSAVRDKPLAYMIKVLEEHRNLVVWCGMVPLSYIRQQPTEPLYFIPSLSSEGPGRIPLVCSAVLILKALQCYESFLDGRKKDQGMIAFQKKPITVPPLSAPIVEMAATFIAHANTNQVSSTVPVLSLKDAVYAQPYVSKYRCALLEELSLEMLLGLISPRGRITQMEEVLSPLTANK